MTIGMVERQAIDMIRWANRENRMFLRIQSDRSTRLRAFTAATRERALCKWLVHNSFWAVRQRLPGRPTPNDDWAQVSRVWSFFSWRPNRADIDFNVGYAEETYLIKTVSWRLQGTDRYKLRVYRDNAGNLRPWSPELFATVVHNQGQWTVRGEGESLIRATWE